MATSAQPGWYPDQTNPGTLRYWDGTAWTEHAAPANVPSATAPIKPGLAAVWITAVLSLFTFYVRTVSATGHTTTVSIPVGIVFMLVCWRLVGRARAEAKRRGVPLPGGYEAARWVALGLAGLSVLASIVAMSS